MKTLLAAIFAFSLAFSASAAEKHAYSSKDTLTNLKSQLEYVLSYGVGMSQSKKLDHIPNYNSLQCPVDISQINPEKLGKEWDVSWKINCLKTDSRDVAYTVLVNISVDSGYPATLDKPQSDWAGPCSAESRKKETIDGMKYRLVCNDGATYINIDAHLIDIAKTY